MIDPAMVRPGRLDKLLYVDLPFPAERVEIFRTLIRKVPIHGDTDEAKAQEKTAIEVFIREKCDGYSGADLAALVREAGVTALKRTLGALQNMDDSKDSTSIFVTSTDFVKALDKVRPSVSVSQRKRYQNLQSKFAGLPVGAVPQDQ